jgi:citrate lyase beta subunit
MFPTMLKQQTESHLRRSLLFMPGDSMRKIKKAIQLPADSIIMDLEDGVAVSQKDVARQTVVEALETLDFGSRERLVRINAVDTPWATEDLVATMAGRPDGYVLPKIESADQVRFVSRALAQLERDQELPEGTIRLLAVIETARGIVNLREIAQADDRLQGLMFGAEDLASDIGAQRTREGWEVFYARSAVVTVAAAFNMQAIDMVFVDLADTDGLAAECRFARQLGYSGKMAIHPRQVPVINEAFSPSLEEVERAAQLLQAFEERQKEGAGVFEWEGKMVDMPIVRAAQRILAQAKAAGMV